MTSAQLSAAPRAEVEYVFPLPHAPRAVSAVRRRVQAVLRRWNLPANAAADVLLVTSELCTNALVHALPPATLRLSRVLVDGRGAVRVDVTDTGPAAPAVCALDLDPDEHGRGLDIVTTLSARCGTHTHSGGGTSRWADVLVG